VSVGNSAWQTKAIKAINKTDLLIALLSFPKPSCRLLRSAEQTDASTILQWEAVSWTTYPNLSVNHAHPVTGPFLR
jgi:hypothetical protein